jgi:hypothetical protein
LCRPDNLGISHGSARSSQKLILASNETLRARRAAYTAGFTYYIVKAYGKTLFLCLKAVPAGYDKLALQAIYRRILLNLRCAAYTESVCTLGQYA